jgi:hypothetical protein
MKRDLKFLGVAMETDDFWKVTSYSSVDKYRRFEVSRCLYLQSYYHFHSAHLRYHIREMIQLLIRQYGFTLKDNSILSIQNDVVQ